MTRPIIPLIFLLPLLALAACQSELPTPFPTRVALPTAAVVAAVPLVDAPPTATVPATFTPAAQELAVATPLPDLQFSAAPTYTPFPTLTPSLTPTFTPSPTPTPTVTPTETATPTPLPTQEAGNFLPNGSFEGGWYHLNGSPELQIPNDWVFEWDEGANYLDPDPWNNFVRPEVRVLPSLFLPAAEHETFIWDGDQTVKVFKGNGALSFRLLADVTLDPGTYLLSIKIYPDLIMDYTPNGTKILADDELAGEVSLVVDGRQQAWNLPTFGQRNIYTATFTITERRTVRVGTAVRGRWALANNGWFMDDWSLQRIN